MRLRWIKTILKDLIPLLHVSIGEGYSYLYITEEQWNYFSRVVLVDEPAIATCMREPIVIKIKIGKGGCFTHAARS